MAVSAGPSRASGNTARGPASRRQPTSFPAIIQLPARTLGTPPPPSFHHSMAGHANVPFSAGTVPAVPEAKSWHGAASRAGGGGQRAGQRRQAEPGVWCRRRGWVAGRGAGAGRYACVRPTVWVQAFRGGWWMKCQAPGTLRIRTAHRPLSTLP